MTSAPIALVVDDERQMRSIVTFALETQGFDCLTAGTASDAWRVLSDRHVDLVVLDVMLPHGSGVELTRRVRAEDRSVPIILLTALRAEADRIAGLEAGADDYLTKPFSPRELALRAQGLLRRAQPEQSRRVLGAGPLRIDRDTSVMSWSGTVVDLGRTEARLLVVLAEHAGEVVSQRDLLNEVWATGAVVGGREMVKASVYRLRRRLAAAGVDPTVIEAHRGLGYRLAVPDGTPPR